MNGARGRLGLAVALPLVVVLFFVGYLSQRPSAASPAQDDLAAMHAELGVDMSAGSLPEGASAATLDDVGPVSGGFLEQLDSLRAVVSEAPDDVDTTLELAGLLQDAHLEAEAIERYERVLADDPSRRQAWLDLANSYGIQQQWDDVRSAMTRMLVTHPDDPSAAYNMGVAYANSGDLEGAREWWTRAMNQGVDLEVSVLAKSSLEQIGG